MTTTDHHPAPRAARGPVKRTERALAPDLARGAMLLFIALANCAGVFFVAAPGVDPTPHGVERAYNLFMFLFVHARAYPMFAIMFGYGLIQLARRQDNAPGASPKAARAVLLRRNAWLVLFGLLHGVLLYSGDFLGAYGIVGIVFTLLLLRRSDRVHNVALWFWGFSLVYVAVLAGLAVWSVVTSSDVPAPAPPQDFPSVVAPDYLSSVLERLNEWPMHTLVLLPFIMFVWLGAWAARRRILEDPANHLPLLRRVTVAALGIGIAGGLPMGLFSAGVLHVDEAGVVWVKMLYEVSGGFGGLGYVALFGLIAYALTKAGAAQSRPKAVNVVIDAVSALGQRSLSGYLFQSLAWLVLASPFMLALSTKTASPTFTAAGCALGVWLVSVIAAYLMQRRSYRGPAEVVLRRLTYGRQS